MKETLKDLGLNTKEIDTYLTLLPIGKAPASVVSYRTGISRSTAKYTCGQLVQKKLFSEVQQGNTALYVPESPDKIMFLLEEEERKLQEKKDRTNRIIGQLKAIVDPGTILPKVRFLDGWEGVRKVYEDTLKEKNDIYAFEHSFRSEDNLKEMSEYIDNHYLPTRLKQGIKAHVIMPSTKNNLVCKKDDQKYKRETRFISRDIFPIEVEVNIYGEKTAFFNYKKDEMFAMIIDSPAITRSMKAIFDVMWNIFS